MMRIAKLRMQQVGCLLAGLIGLCYSLAVGQSSEVKAGYAKTEHMIPKAAGVGGCADLPFVSAYSADVRRKNKPRLLMRQLEFSGAK